MKKNDSILLWHGIDSARAVSRLTALWALCEAGFGGLLHAFKIPFSGIMVGGTSIMLIALITCFSEKKGPAILKALIIVLMVKVAVSPYSPLPAYFAVCFQALCGVAVFSLFASFRLSALLLAVISMVESGLQKIIVLTVIYGKSIWESVDIYFDHVAAQFGQHAGQTAHGASFWIIALYLGIHAVAGVLIGWMAGGLPLRISEFIRNQKGSAPGPAGKKAPDPGFVPGRKKLFGNKIVRYALAMAAIAASFIIIAPAGFDRMKGFYVLVRAVTILILWYFLVAPLLTRLLRAFLKRKGIPYGQEIENILALFPELKTRASRIWFESHGIKGPARLMSFFVALVVFGLYGDTCAPVYTGPVDPPGERSGEAHDT